MNNWMSSVRKTTVSKLKKANLEGSDIITVTGHRSLQSLDDYDEADKEGQWQLSLAISNENEIMKNRFNGIDVIDETDNLKDHVHCVYN